MGEQVDVMHTLPPALNPDRKCPRHGVEGFTKLVIWHGDAEHRPLYLMGCMERECPEVWMVEEP